VKIEIDNLSFGYNSPWISPKTILRDISVKIQPGEFIALAGPSGSGKTTLIQHFTGLLKPDHGRILVDSSDIWTNMKWTELRRRIGLVFQFPETQLFETTVFDEVSFGLKRQQCSEQEIERRVCAALTSVGLEPNLVRQRSPFRLSEGEKRRVAIASVVALEPDVLVLDEPTAGLDAAGESAIVSLLTHQSMLKKSIILVTHDVELIAVLAQRVIILHQGQVLFDGLKQELFERPETIVRAGLDFPSVLRIADKLRCLGFSLPSRPNTLAQLKQALCEEVQLKGFS